ncbi:MAG: hypothetical protein JJT88_19045 [Gammaproteobacteria bacterium]|nr:hypothetical protein [Gammaproteobacteria bacterium]
MSMVYSELRQRMLRTPTHALSLVTRIKPSLGILGRLRRPWRFRVERYRPEGTDGSVDIAVKYALGSHKRIENEKRAITQLKRCGAESFSGLMFPETVTVEGLWAQGIGLVTPWKDGGTLSDRISAGSAEPAHLARLFEQCSRALRSLHDVPIGDAEVNEPAEKPLMGPGGAALVGDPLMAALVEPVLRTISFESLESNLEPSACWAHGDCFGYQFFLDQCGGGMPWLCDWETARVRRTGLGDLAQLWASIELALAMDPSLSPHLPLLWEAFQEGYDRDLEGNLCFRVLELKALVRFSPRTWKFAVVVPTNMLTKRGAKSADAQARKRLILTKYEQLLGRRTEGLEALVRCVSSFRSPSLARRRLE